ncbi:MAG: secretin N-terminal domain-containing protein [Bdellovibrionales bacterium]
MPKLSQLALAILLLVNASCSDTTSLSGEKIDPSGNMTRNDYLALRERGKVRKGKKPAAAPFLTMDEQSLAASLPPLLDAPPVPDLPEPQKPPELLADAQAPTQSVNVAVTESVPLRDVLIELGREGGVNMEIDPRITGGIIFTAKDQPFTVVLRRICDLAGLRYSTDGDFIRVELDEPYQKTYAMDFLSLSRKTTSEVTIATNVFDVDLTSNNSTSSTTRSSNGSDNNSTAKISANANADFWSEVEKSLPKVLTTASQKRTLIAHDKENGDSKGTNFSIDRQAGLITVFGNERQQHAVQSYLDQLQQKASAQVLIEARIVEVELADEFQSGVNWSALLGNTMGVAANFGTVGAGAAMTTASSGLFSAALETDDFSGILQLVRTFGATRVLSSPRLTVMNNQTAVLKVARNEVYFLTSAQFPTTTNSNGVVVSGTPVFSSTPRTVPVGLVMTVQPAINAQTGRVTMTLRPTISRVVDRVTDPSIGLNAAYSGNDTSVQSQIPVLAVREMDSVLQLQSGEVAVMGGLMQDSSENQDQGIPPFDRFPVLGNLTKARDNNGHTSELVILLRATILNDARPDAADMDLYERYNRDPRPFDLPQT